MINENDVRCFIPFTISKKKSINYLSFYGEAIEIYSKIDLKKNQISKILKIFLNKINLKNLKFKIFFKYDEKKLIQKILVSLIPIKLLKKQEIELCKKKKGYI